MLKPSGRSEPETDRSTGANARQAPTIVPVRLQPGVDPLDGFKPEQAVRSPDAVDRFTHSGRVPSNPAHHASARPIKVWVLAGVAALAVVVTGAFYFYSSGREGGTVAPPSSTGRAVLNSRPAGALVLIDGVERGTTPLQLELPPGSHDVMFRAGSSERRLTIVVEPGTRTSENIDLPPTPVAPAAPPRAAENGDVPQLTSSGASAASTQGIERPASAPGQLQVTSEPSGAQVSIDGSFAGVTPLVMRGLSPTRHAVVVSQGAEVVNRSVNVRSGATASLFVSLGQTIDGVTGWFIVESPVELRILEGGRMLGLSTAAPLILPSGRHDFELTNEETELRIAVTVQIDPGKPTRLSVPLPTGTLSMNATPWAEVFLDGRSLGVTPLGNVQVPVGRHDLVWRHPQLGVKRSSVIVGARTPVRVSMEFEP